MKALKKTRENLDKVIESITSVPFSHGGFVVTYRDKATVTLSCIGRSSIGSTILNLIPSNWVYRVSVTFEDGDFVMKLYIWLV